MGEAIATLKRTGKRRNFLYELPWYIIIGPPGAGKTTALVNSGLKFPLAGSGEAQPVSGVGGTRYCDWWFTEEAVIIDTAGRYTTQDSDSDNDKKSWLAFLTLLKRHRGRQPINGVILAISLSDLMTLNAQAIAAHAIEIRNRLQELHDELGVEFPVYLLFTKADLVVGFMEYFATADEDIGAGVWGATFQVASRGDNLIGDAPAEFDGARQPADGRDARPAARRNGPGSADQHLWLSEPVRCAQAGRARFSWPRVRARPQAVAGQPARLLFLVRHAGRHADRPGAGRDGPQLRRRRTRASVGRRQELLPA